MNILSLFDGMGSGFLALRRAGIRINEYYSSEIEQSVMDIANINFPKIIQLGDILNWREWDLPKIDLIIGGSPCQGFSRQGKHLNFEHPQSKLFFAFVDIVNDIKKKNPDVLFMLENVSMKKEWTDVITEYLGVDYIEINSNLVSAQNRIRLYWTNIPNVTVPEDKGIKLIDIIDRDHVFPYTEYQGLKIENKIYKYQRDLISVVDGEVRIKEPTKKGYAVAEHGDGLYLEFPKSATRRARVAKGKSHCLDTYCKVSVLYDGKIRRLTRNELERLQNLPDNFTLITNMTKAKQALGNGWTIDVIAHILKFIDEK